MDEDMLKNTNYLLSFSEAAVEDQRSSPAASFGSGFAALIRTLHQI